MSWAFKAFLLAVAFAAGGATGIKWHAGIDAQKELTAKTARAEKERNDRRAVDMAAESHEADRVQIRTVYVKAKQEIANVVRTPFYADSQLCLDDDGLRAANAAGRTAAPGLAVGASLAGRADLRPAAQRATPRVGLAAHQPDHQRG